MYIRSLSAKNLKRLHDLTLEFTHEDGTPRMWTVLIGENGTGKSTVLQAIALAAAGKLRVNDLAGSAFAHLADRRQKSALQIDASFAFTPTSLTEPKVHPLIGQDTLPSDLHLTSRVRLKPKETSLRAESWYGDSPEPPAGAGDPLDQARATEAHLWFVIGYGVHRMLPQSGGTPDLSRPSVDRMKPLFDPQYPLTSTGFISHYGARQAKARAYSTVLKQAIIDTNVLPEDIENLELRGYGGVSRSTDLLERNRFQQKMGPDLVKVPAVALGHGYQSTIAWIADLVGHILLEAKNTELSPEEFEGLVLIDEIDLYLHPKWQARLIPALRKTFPKLQFVATTHSPVVLATLSPEEVVRLSADPVTGNVRRITPDADTGVWDEVDKEADLHTQPDPRAMTGTEMYREYFGVDRLTLNEHGDQVRSYTALATNPHRTEHQNRRMEELRRELTDSLVEGLVEPVPNVDSDDSA
jgi:hypothetical protein